MSDNWNVGKTAASTCPTCGGSLIFDPTLGKLRCEFCDTTYTPEEVEAEWAKKGIGNDTGSDSGQDAVRDYEGQDFTAEDGMRSYSCSTCGAELMADNATAVMRCPYCGNQTIVEQQFSGSIRPDYIIPFTHTKDQAESKYLDFYKKRFLLPKSFKTDNHVEEIQGVYVPFWLFSGRVHINGDYIAYDESKDSKGNKHITARYEEHREGYLDYEKVPSDASVRMDDDLMDSVEPYELNGIKDFSMVYLPGFLAERYDVEEEECLKRGHERAEGSIKEQVRKTIKRDGIEESNEKFKYENESTDYALFPVWLLVTKWKDKTFKFAMNGQTGKMVGDLPVSAPKLLAVVIPLFLIVTFLGSTFSENGILDGLLAGLVVSVIVGFIMYASMKSVSKASTAGGYITQSLKLVAQDEKKVGAFQAKKAKEKIRQK